MALSPVPNGGPRGRCELKRLAQTAVQRRGLELVRRVRIDPALREDGREIWPDTAETMIGLARLNQLQAAIEDVIAKNVRGDLVERMARRSLHLHAWGARCPPGH